MKAGYWHRLCVYADQNGLVLLQASKMRTPDEFALAQAAIDALCMVLAYDPEATGGMVEGWSGRYVYARLKLSPPAGRQPQPG